jgi:hypothetical protein
MSPRDPAFDAARIDDIREWRRRNLDKERVYMLGEELDALLAAIAERDALVARASLECDG